ncbi:MAG: alkyl hydroperoxide reductase [Puniceicoccaceae bacterium 5H]|nr:MAG: alkyl hydroperoxide reductase [Puniceicoccaceae bacterium 5H]
MTASFRLFSLFALSFGLSAALNAQGSLQQQLDARTKAAEGQISPTVKKTMAEALQALQDQNITQHALQVGDRVPSFSLPNAVGDEIALADLLEQGPVVVTFYRGGWCPYCNLQLAMLQQYLPALNKAGAQLVAISPESPDQALSVREKHELEFQVLSDDNNDVARWFGIVYQLPDDLVQQYQQWGIPLHHKRDAADAYELPLAATYVIDRQGIVRWAFLNADYTQRAEPRDIVAAVEKL